MTSTMLIASHKQAPVPSSSLYVPVHVGHALNPADFGFRPDDSGDNISAKNRSYCELTAVYWAWKNIDATAYGLSHYRRYFAGTMPGPNGSKILSADEANTLLLDFDVVLGKPRNYVIETIDSHYRNGHHGEDLDVLRAAIERRSPEYLSAYDTVFQGRKLSLYNMFLMRAEAFEAYCSWLFPLLSEVETHIDESDRTSYQQRTMGYLGERLLNVWVQAHPELRTTHRKIVNTEGEPKIEKAIKLMQRKITGRRQQ
ncbi:DUF4422 domain-containing protein [Microbacterium sp. YY-03]|uniref:DUF4422 domain-containing protein n=1 Tax=Microbacterium sp. YY-03 TaxID=3421636 RepID=UPI003D1681AD